MTAPEVPQKSPYVLDLEPGSYAWCACGRSATQPYCDGTHKGSGIKPIVCRIEEPKQVAWCGCKHSKNPPFCDGTHAELES